MKKNKENSKKHEKICEMNTERMRGKSGCLYSKKALFWGSPDDGCILNVFLCSSTLRYTTLNLSKYWSNSKTKEKV